MIYNCYTVPVVAEIVNIAEWAIRWCTGESQIIGGGSGIIVKVIDPGQFTHPDAEFIGQEVVE